MQPRMRAAANRPDKKILIDFFPKQNNFADAVFSGKYNYLMYGGAIRGGKTVVMLGIILVLAKAFAKSRWAIVRKDLPTLKRNTLPSFERIRPSNFASPVNRSDWSVKCSNGSEILFFPESVKDDPDLDRWKGLEVNGFALEEANELREQSFNKAIERAGSWRVPEGQQPIPLVLLTCNPAKGYVKRLFYDPWKEGRLKAPFFYQPAKLIDNPYNDEAYVRSLGNLQRTDPVAYRRFVEGDWEVSDDPQQLIHYEWLLAAKNVERIPGRKKLGVDVARFGDDDSVIAHLDGNALVRMEYHHGLSTDQVAGLVELRTVEGTIDGDQINVDSVGLGAGVVDSLRAKGINCNEVIGGASPIPRPESSFFKFKNLRSQIYWEAREQLRKGERCIEIEDNRLFEDLTAVRYAVTSDKTIEIEPKEDTKRRIGRSPDAGDAYVYVSAEMQTSEHVAMSGFDRGAQWAV